MNASRRTRHAPRWYTVAVQRCLVLGLLLTCLLPVALAEEEERVSRRQQELDALEILGAVYDKIIWNYVDEVDPDAILEAGINAMLGELDPHSQYLPPVSYEDLMMSTEGEFGGLGITINVRNHYPTVISPIEGTPAYYMGIRGGDQIVEIEGQSSYDFTSRDAVKLLRGPPGSQVDIKIARPGVDEPIPFTITRDIIKVESVPYSFMIGDIGYIRVQNFARTTADEIKESLDTLEAQQMRGLILDLRFNPGGLLEAAKQVSELFLDKGQLLVFTKGRLRSQNASFYSDPRGRVFNEVPTVVLLNGSSASASEIVAAALQDHDSALVVGKTSFGKGSVQTVFRLNEDEALKLTTARYYTPSGRSIHKDRLRDDEQPADDEVTDLQQDPAELEIPRHEKEQFHTDMGRIVYGSGGVTPDIEIEQDLLTNFEVAVERDYALFSYAVDYAAAHEDIPEDFRVSDEMFADFKEFLVQRENIEEYLGVFELAPSDSLFDANSEFLRRGIRRELARRVHGPEAAYKVAIEADTQLHEVLALFDEARSLADLLALAEQWNAEHLEQMAIESAEVEEAGVTNR